MKDNIKIYLQGQPEMRGIACWIFDEPIGQMQHKGIATNLEFETLTDDNIAVHHNPLFYLNEHSAQHLMNELWKEGVRPSDIGTAGHLESVKYHLEDMRKLVFESKNKY